jgi:two-component system, response regulator, stage 0 sporulation protein F
MNRNAVKVLVVDDEIAFANTLAQRLTMRDMKVGTACDGEQALSKVNSEKPDVIVLDLNMPGMHGMEVLQKIKKSHPDIQVIVLTGHGTEKDAEEAKRLGGFDFLNKPADIDNLASKIRKAWQVKFHEQ